ncbi:phosphatase PAP2 family protein [Bradyrhizobium sp. UFLA05-109]
MTDRTSSGHSLPRLAGAKSGSPGGLEHTVSLQLYQLNWALAAFALTALSVSLLLTEFRLQPSGYLSVLGGAALYGVIGRLNASSQARSKPQIYFSLFAMAQMTVLLPVLTSLTYVAAAANLPLQDANLLSFDRLLGLDFRAYLAFMNDRPMLANALAVIYNSIQWQILLVVVFLPLMGCERRTAEFIMAFAIALVATTVISTLLPATGVYGTLGLREEEFPNIVPGCYYYGMREIPPVRDGTLRLLDVFHLGPVLTFPSFHAVTAVLYAWACWPVRYLRTAGLFWNGAMVVSTPVNGGHYFVDILAGMAVAALSIAAVKGIGALIARSRTLRMEHVAANSGSERVAFALSELQGQEG